MKLMAFVWLSLVLFACTPPASPPSNADAKVGNAIFRG